MTLNENLEASAFPESDIGECGMTKLEYFTAAAMQGILANPDMRFPRSGIADEALAMAIHQLDRIKEHTDNVAKFRDSLKETTNEKLTPFSGASYDDDDDLSF